MSTTENHACGTKRARAGRPPDPSKDRAIMAAARELFFQRGFGGTTIEEIAQQAGVSKVTVYKRFCDKETLFENCVRDEVATMVTIVDIGDGSSESLETRLNAFGVMLLTFIFHPRHVALNRVLAQEFAMLPVLGRRMFEAGPAQSRARLADLLAEACEEELIECDDPLRAAEDLSALWRGFLEAELKFGVRTEVDEKTIRDRVEHGTSTFLRAYQRRKNEEPK